MVHHSRRRRIIRHTAHFLLGVTIGLFLFTIFAGISMTLFEKKYQGKVFPGVTISESIVSGKTPDEVKQIWLTKNNQFTPLTFTFQFENNVATISAASINAGYDATVSATQAYSVGRSGNFLSDVYNTYQAATTGLTLTPLFHWDSGTIDETVSNLADQIDIPAQNALLEFNNGRVSAFAQAKDGRAVDVQTLDEQFAQKMAELANGKRDTNNIIFNLPVKIISPQIGNEKINNLGITELIGSGTSTYFHSIPGRVHNVALGASRVNGVLIAPGDTFSFNQAVGDISAATGYKQAYVIKNGRTVLDDGGGICQVSTTLFRAALNAGLPIVERHAHSYRVGYYEQGGWKPGFDATVYAPSYDLKFKNDTGHSILIQTKVDTDQYRLTFELYGTKDGRTATLSNAHTWDPQPAPPDLYQDDPTLPVGTVKQVDFAAAGLKAAFDYTVTKNGEVLYKNTFVSNFEPWQAVYLRGTKN